MTNLTEEKLAAEVKKIEAINAIMKAYAELLLFESSKRKEWFRQQVEKAIIGVINENL